MADSLVSDEFEFIESIGEETDQPWSIQQSIRIEPVSIQLPGEVPLSHQTLVSNPGQDSQMNTLKTLNDNNSTLVESPILADSLVSEKEVEMQKTPVASVVPSAQSTLVDASIIEEKMCSTSTSLVNLSEMETTERALRASLGYVSALKKQLQSQNEKIAELEQTKSINKEVQELNNSAITKKQLEAQKAYYDAEMEKMTREHNQKIKEKDLILEAHVTAHKSAVNSLKDSLASANQAAELWKQNAERNTGVQYSDQKTVIDRLIEENKQLRELVDEKTARYLEAKELSKIFESQVKEFTTNPTANYDLPASFIAKELKNKTEYSIHLEEELIKVRKELNVAQEAVKKMTIDTGDKNEIVNILREDQLESTRELAARDHKIQELEKIVKKLGVSLDDFAT